MSKWKFTGVDKLKEGDVVEKVGFIYVPKPLQWKRKPRPDIKGTVEAYDEQEAMRLARGQIKRLWPHCKLQDIEEVRE